MVEICYTMRPSTHNVRLYHSIAYSYRLLMQLGVALVAQPQKATLLVFIYETAKGAVWWDFMVAMARFHCRSWSGSYSNATAPASGCNSQSQPHALPTSQIYKGR